MRKILVSLLFAGLMAALLPAAADAYGPGGGNYHGGGGYHGGYGGHGVYGGYAHDGYWHGGYWGGRYYGRGYWAGGYWYPYAYVAPVPYYYAPAPYPSVYVGIR